MTSELPTYRFDDIQVEIHSFRVFKAGRMLALEPKAFEVLVFLLTHHNHLIAKEEILNSVWKNSFVTPNAMTRVIAQLRKALGDTRKEPKYIETIQTRGYRFIAKVEIVASASLPASQFIPLQIASEPTNAEFVSAQSLAVLPLENLSGDPAQEYFADGFTDELITQLAMRGSLKVVSRTSAMQYKRAQKSLPQIAQELNVDLVVEGSVFCVGNRVRITAQLILAAQDQHLWAKSYERTMTDVFALQKEVAGAITEEIIGRLAMPLAKTAKQG